MNTNSIPLDPQTQAALQSLPSQWQHVFVLIMAIIAALTTLGRILTPLLANQGLLAGLRATFMGSSHAQTTLAIPPPPATPSTQPPAAKV